MDKNLIELYRSTASIEKEGAEHRSAFAAALGPLVNEEVARESAARQIFPTLPIPMGAEARFDKDTEELDAWAMPVHGRAVQQLVESDQIFVPTYEIMSSAEWKIQYAEQARFDVLQRQVFKMKNAIVKKEDRDALALIHKAAELGTPVGGAGVTKLDLAFVNSLFTELETREGYTPDLFIMSPRRAADFREWASTQLTPETFKEIHTKAAVGNFWNVDIMKWWDLSDDEVYLIDTSRFGVMPIKKAFSMHEDPSAIINLRVRYVGYEEIGMAFLDPKAIVKGVIGG